ncbi:MAG: hypothetical protein VX742_09750 [Actinomycetota bacterium]|nr:hypothetical protein [Actinomycetota bacterium]
MAGDEADGGAQADVDLLEINLEWHRVPDEPIRSEAAMPRSSSNWRLDPRWLIGAAVLAYLLWLFGIGEASDGGSSAPDARTPVTTPAADERPGAGAEAPLDIAADIAALTDLELRSSYLEVIVDGEGNDQFTHIQPFDAIRGEPRFVFVGADRNPIVVDTAEGVLASITEEISLTSFDGDLGALVLLRDDRGVVGLDPDRPDLAIRVSSGSVVVERHTGDHVVVARTITGIEFGEYVTGENRSRTEVPVPTSLAVIAGVGIFMQPGAGGTYEVTGDGLVQVSVHDVVTTNGTRWLERRQAATGIENWIVDADGRTWVLDGFDVGGDVVISPDGQWIYLSRGTALDDVPILYGVESGEIVTLDSRKDGLQAVWSPNSDFLASLDLERECLWIDFVNGLTGCLSLTRLSIPADPASFLVVY